MPGPCTISHEASPPAHLERHDPGKRFPLRSSGSHGGCPRKALPSCGSPKALKLQVRANYRANASPTIMTPRHGRFHERGQPLSGRHPRQEANVPGCVQDDMPELRRLDRDGETLPRWHGITEPELHGRTVEPSRRPPDRNPAGTPGRRPVPPTFTSRMNVLQPHLTYNDVTPMPTLSRRLAGDGRNDIQN